jgi:hypothetical protein
MKMAFTGHRQPQGLAIPVNSAILCSSETQEEADECSSGSVASATKEAGREEARLIYK